MRSAFATDPLLAAQCGEGSYAHPLCAADHPLHTGFAKMIGTAVSETTMRPDPSRFRTPQIGRGSFASVPHAAGYLCLCHAGTALQVELKQDSNGWFSLRGGGPDAAVGAPAELDADDAAEAERPRWHTPADACIWSNGTAGARSHGRSAPPLAHFAPDARR